MCENRDLNHVGVSKSNRLCMKYFYHLDEKLDRKSSQRVSLSTR